MKLHGFLTVVLVAASLMVAAGGASASASTSATPISATLATCPVTPPSTNPAPGDLPRTLHTGNDQLSADLWPEGVVLDTPSLGDVPGKPFGAKWGWWRGVSGKLTVTGRRLDGAAPPLTADVPDGYGLKGFQVTGINFPTPGCWEVTGRVGDASLTFVTLVVEIVEPPMAPVAATPNAVASPSAACQATVPNGDSPSGEPASPYWHRAGNLWVVLWPGGTITLPAGFHLADGVIELELNWWRGASGTLSVTGQRLDGPAPALGVVVPDAFGPTGYQTTSLFFPTAGCWQLTASTGQSSATVVVQINTGS